VFSTYQSSAQVAKAQKLAGKKFDLTIADEAHRLTGKNDTEFATVLDAKKIPTKKLLFMTATPRTYTPAIKQIASDRGVEISSMDDEKVFGKELHKLSFGQAIEQDLLTDYRVVIVGVTDPQVQELIERRELVSVGGKVETDARTLAAHIGLAKAVKDYNLKKTISFHGRIKTAQAFAQDFVKIVDWMPDDHKPSGTFWADTITGAMNSSERRILLEKLKADVPNQHSLLSNARCLTEGIDVPSLDGVAFIDPRSSQVDIIQAVGRAIRKAKNKDLGTIVLPVLIPHDVDPEHALENSSFKPIWNIISALRSHDESLANELDSLRFALGSQKQILNSLPKIVEDLPIGISAIFPNFASSLMLKLVEESSDKWHWWLGLLSKFTNEHGTCHIAAKSKYLGHSLGNWIHIQRRKKKLGKLSQEQVTLLEQIPLWSWSPFDDKWEARFERIMAFAIKNGHCRIPRRDGERDDRGAWIQKQRARRKSGDLSQHEIERIQSIPGWTWDPLWEDWLDFYNQLLAFAALHGNLAVPDSSVEYKSLANWVSRQRTRGRENLNATQIEMLESVKGWTWDLYEAVWNEKFDLLKDFAAINGHTRMPKNEVAPYIGLRAWISKNRTNYRLGKIDSQKLKLLESVPGGQWDPFESRWYESFDRIKELSNDDAQYPKRGGKFDIGAWVAFQRMSYFANDLPKEKIELLESLPNWTWDPIGERWNYRYAELLALSDQTGSSRIPNHLFSNYSELNSWITQQRKKFKSGKLLPKEITLLTALPDWTWDPLTEKWERHFQATKDFILKFGHCDIPATLVFDELGLGRWVVNQRVRKRKLNLPKELEERLAALPHWKWDPRDASRERAFQLLSKFLQREGHANVLNNHKEEGFSLGSWVSAMRSAYRQSKLDASDIQRLNQYPGWLWQGDLGRGAKARDK
jgi:hypothetical protein